MTQKDLEEICTFAGYELDQLTMTHIVMASKMSVANDTPEAYTKFVFAEFLEVLLRLAL